MLGIQGSAFGVRQGIVPLMHRCVAIHVSTRWHPHWRCNPSYQLEIPTVALEIQPPAHDVEDGRDVVSCSARCKFCLRWHYYRSGSDHRIAHPPIHGYRTPIPGQLYLRGALLRDLISAWRTWEAHLGLAIDLRTFSLVAASHDEFGPRVREPLEINTTTSVTVAAAAGVLSGLLWPRIVEVRSRTFQSYGPFRTRGYTDPSLVRELLLLAGPHPVEYGTEGWREALTDSLASTGIVRVRADTENVLNFHAEIYRILASPVDVDYLQLYPIVTEVSRGTGTTVTFVLREMF